MTTRLIIGAAEGAACSAIALQRHMRFGTDDNRTIMKPGEPDRELELSDEQTLILLVGKPLDAGDEDADTTKVKIMVADDADIEVPDGSPKQKRVPSTTGLRVHTRSTKTGRDEDDAEDIEEVGASTELEIGAGKEGVVIGGAPFGGGANNNPAAPQAITKTKGGAGDQGQRDGNQSEKPGLGGEGTKVAGKDDASKVGDKT